MLYINDQTGNIINVRVPVHGGGWRPMRAAPAAPDGMKPIPIIRTAADADLARIAEQAAAKALAVAARAFAGDAQTANEPAAVSQDPPAENAAQGPENGLQGESDAPAAAMGAEPDATVTAPAAPGPKKPTPRPAAPKRTTTKKTPAKKPAAKRSTTSSRKAK